MSSSPPLRIITVGHVDHGKSTLLGRLLYDTSSLTQEQQKALHATSQGVENIPEFSSLLDSFEEEQSQNITIDTTQLPFRTATRDYLLIDAPGHKEFLKNMITGTTRADAAVLVLDAREGIQEQTRRHIRLLSLLGIKQIIVTINKMDLLNYTKAPFENHKLLLEKFFQEAELSYPQAIIPIAARLGKNIITRTNLMSWYEGPSLMEAFSQLTTPVSLEQHPLRFVVQDVYRFDERRLIAGRIEAGKLSVGEEIIFWPHGKKSRIHSLEIWKGSPLFSATAGQSIALTLEEPIFVERGQIGSHILTPPLAGSKIQTRLFWIDQEELSTNRLITFKLGTQAVKGTLLNVRKNFDAVNLDERTTLSPSIALHEIAEATFHLHHPIAYDSYEDIATTGRFVIEIEDRIGGAGIIIPSQISTPSQKSTHLSWVISDVSRESRKKQFGHQGAIFWFTGLSGSGKSTLASALETTLHRQGRAVFLLDGDNLRHGLCSDLGFSEKDRSENIRRTGEVAKLFAEAGLIVLCALISPFQEDRNNIRNACIDEKLPFFEIFVDASLATCEARDPRGLYKKARRGEIIDFTGISSPYEIPTAASLVLSTENKSLDESFEELYDFVSTALGLAGNVPQT